MRSIGVMVKKVFGGLKHRAHKLRIAVHGIFRKSVIYSAYGIPITMNQGDKTFEFYVSGAYGNYLWRRISNIKEKFVFLDIGANQGLYTVCAALNQNNMRSYAFEPIPDIFNLLEKNVQLNGVAGRCTLVNKAISDSCSLQQISFSNDHSGRSSLATHNDFNFDVSHRLRIETIDGATLNTLVWEKNIPIVAKIDVEGYEQTVISQLVETSLAEMITEVFYEVDEQWTNPEEIERLLYSIGFRTFEKIGEGTHYDILATR